MINLVAYSLYATHIIINKINYKNPKNNLFNLNHQQIFSDMI